MFGYVLINKEELKFKEFIFALLNIIMEKNIMF